MEEIVRIGDQDSIIGGRTDHIANDIASENSSIDLCFLIGVGAIARRQRKAFVPCTVWRDVDAHSGGGTSEAIVSASAVDVDCDTLSKGAICGCVGTGIGELIES